MLNQVKIYSISISLCAVFVSFLIDSSHAQSVEFKTYTNDDWNFTIKYPADWEVIESGLIFTEAVVEFDSPDSASFVVLVRNVTQYLDTDTMTIKNLTSEEYAQQELKVASQMLQPDPNVVYKPIRSNEFPVAGNVGWRIEYVWGYVDEAYFLRVFTIANDKVYELRYSAFPINVNVPKTFALANKIVESFQIKR